MLGKWAQNQNRTQTTLFTSEKVLYELMTSPGIEVTNLIFPNDDVAWISWKYTEDHVAAGKNVNVADAAYVTTLARLKLYEYLRELRESVLCCDTDSVIYIQNIDEAPKLKTGDYLGDLTDEVEFGSGSFIEEFVLGGPKSMNSLSFAPPQRSVHLNIK
jgi:hypothetical protein